MRPSTIMAKANIVSITLITFQIVIYLFPDQMNNYGAVLIMNRDSAD